MRKGWVTLVVIAGSLTTLSAQISKEAIQLTPNGKGWGVETEAPREGGTFGNKPATTNGMGYHRGPVMHANPVNVYFIGVRQLDERSQAFRQPDDCEPDGRFVWTDA
jgi:hypothetical protein